MADDKGLVEQYIGVFTDITNQKTAEEELKKMAHSDPLTGIANRYSYNIGQLVLRQVCRDLKTLEQFGFNKFSLAVNVSPLQFLQDDCGIISDENVPARFLELAVTESTVMLDAKKSVQRLTELKSIRFKLSIDDFGTGYLSLSYLRRFPIDHLKIDRSFIQSIDQFAELIDFLYLDLTEEYE